MEKYVKLESVENVLRFVSDEIEKICNIPIVINPETKEAAYKNGERNGAYLAYDSVRERLRELLLSASILDDTENLIRHLTGGKTSVTDMILKSLPMDACCSVIDDEFNASCPNCGKELDRIVFRCPYCGQALTWYSLD